MFSDISTPPNGGVDDGRIEEESLHYAEHDFTPRRPISRPISRPITQRFHPGYYSRPTRSWPSQDMYLSEYPIYRLN